MPPLSEGEGFTCTKKALLPEAAALLCFLFNRTCFVSAASPILRQPWDSVIRETSKEATEVYSGEFKIKGNSLDILVTEMFNSLHRYFLN